MQYLVLFVSKYKGLFNTTTERMSVVFIRERRDKMRKCKQVSVPGRGSARLVGVEKAEVIKSLPLVLDEEAKNYGLT